MHVLCITVFFNHVKQELFTLYDALSLLYQFTKTAKVDLKIP